MRAAPSDRAFVASPSSQQAVSTPWASIPSAHLEQIVALQSHPDARRYCLEFERAGSELYGARIYPPERQHMRQCHPLSGSFYGCGSSPQEALDRAILYYREGARH